MKTVQVTIEGTSPLLINRFKEQDELPAKVSKGKRDYGSPREQAEATAYRDDKDKKIWIPSTWVSGAIKSVSSDYRLPGTRKSVKSVSGGAIVPVEEKCYFLEGYCLENVEIDSRPVVVQRARIMRHRARLEKWTFCVHLQIDEEIVPVNVVHDLLVDSGKRAGMGDFRPQKSGPYGRFHITKWKVLKEEKGAVR